MLWWIPLAGAALGAAMGSEQQKAQDASRRADAMANMYAPLFGKAPTSLGPRKDIITPGALSGAMAGFGMMNQLGGTGAQPVADSADPNTSSWIPYGQTANQSTGVAAPNPYDFFGRANPYANAFGGN